MGAVRETINYSLLRMSYADKSQLKKLLRMWSTLEELGSRGDAVAICILTDFQNVTGIDMDIYYSGNRKAFNDRYKKGVLRPEPIKRATVALLQSLGQSYYADEHQYIAEALKLALESRAFRTFKQLIPPGKMLSYLKLKDGVNPTNLLSELYWRNDAGHSYADTDNNKIGTNIKYDDKGNIIMKNLKILTKISFDN